MYYVYVLNCADKTLYVGYTKNLQARYKQHNSNKVISTQRRLPAKLVYYECFISKKDAKAREIYLKSGSGRDQLRNILKYTI